jgi:uncharacterized repeat protein (TIGR02543 family)
MGKDFTFSDSWNDIKAVGNNFANYMFSGISGADFKMNEVFNLPSGITVVGNNFASNMFSGNYGASFTMNEIFNLPGGITTVGDYFASNMFSGNYHANFMMNEVFNLPSEITTVGNNFASSMFSGCYGANFTMNEVFNLPSEITTVGDYFASNMFSGCYGENFTMNKVFNLPSGIEFGSNNFASNMFSGCYGASFTMNDVFNLPNEITYVGTQFAYEMFKNCYGENFTMNEVFNLPSEITSVGDYFANYMFSGCYGKNFTMNEVFNLPSRITLVNNYFASYMFSSCSGASFTMNEVFNLPSGIAPLVRNYFANNMFSGCSGTSFTMNEVFNLPSGITYVGEYFASNMFYGCYGTAFMVNNEFKFPILEPDQLNKSNVFYQTFYNSGNASTSQTRTATSIINNNPSSTSSYNNKQTFTGSRFSDLEYIPAYWGGSGRSITVTFASNGGSAVTAYNNVAVDATIDAPEAPTRTDYAFSGWYKDAALTNAWNFATDKVAASMTLYAKWTTYTVSFDLNDGGILFSEDFEGSTHSFTLVNGNGSQNNQWAIGTATAANGSKSAYISNDNGTSNSYSTSYSSTVHIYSSVTFPVYSEAYTLKFDWKGVGNSNYAYLEVRLAENLSSIYAGSTAVGPVLGTFSGSSSWQQASVSIPASNSGTTKYLVFTWVNYYNGGTNPPIAVDNIVLAGAVPPSPIYITPPGDTIPVAQKPETSDFTRTGYTHDGKWHTRTGTSEADYVYTEFVFGEGGTEVTSDTTLYLKWIPDYKVTFDLNGSTETAPSPIYIMPPGDTIPVAQKPETSSFTRNDYTHDSKWHTRTGTSEADYVYTEFVFGEGGTKVTGDITLYLKWTPIYTVTFDLNDGGILFSEDFEGSTHSFTLVNGSYTNAWAVGTATAYDGSKSAYISNNSGTSNSYTTSYPSTVHIYRSVTFPASSEAYTLKFDWKGVGEYCCDYLEVYLADESSSIVAGSVPSGTWLRTFEGYSSWQQASISIPASNDGTTKLLVFTWRNDNGSGSNPPIAVDNILATTGAMSPASIADVLHGGILSTAQKPETSGFTRKGYAHDGKWYIRTGTSEADYVYTEFVFGSTPITSNTTLYLKWTPVYTVGFDLNGGTGTTPASITNMLSSDTLSTAQKPSTSGFTRNGYANDGKWHTRTGTSEADYVYTEFVFGKGGTPVTDNVALYLKWTINTYTVTFIDHDGTQLSWQTVEHGSAATAPGISSPIEGYAFTGWDKEFNAVTENLTVTAQYETNTYAMPYKAVNNCSITQIHNGINLAAKTSATVTVYNLSGKLINRQNYHAGNHSISLGHLPKGVYIVKVSYGSEKQILQVPVR